MIRAPSGPEALRAHVETLAGEIGERNVFRPRALADAADFIAREWRRQGYEVVPQTYDCQGLPCANLEIARRGTRRPEEIVLVGAHYDSVIGSPGADDNASGVAALLAMSRRFAEAAPARTVRFVAFVNEEPPLYFTRDMGSRVYAKAARARGDDIRLMISLETIGYYSETPGSQHYPPLFRLFFPGRGNFVAFVSNLRSRRLGLPCRAPGHVRPRPRRGLERPPLVLAGGVSRADGHRHGVLPVPALPLAPRHAGQAQLWGAGPRRGGPGERRRDPGGRGVTRRDAGASGGAGIPETRGASTRAVNGDG